MARKSFQYRLNPTKKQARALQDQLDECRWLYNEFLEQRKSTYEKSGISLSKYEQQNLLPLFKEKRPSLSKIHSQVLQNVMTPSAKAEGFYGLDTKAISSESCTKSAFRVTNVPRLHESERSLASERITNNEHDSSHS